MKMYCSRTHENTAELPGVLLGAKLENITVVPKTSSPEDNLEILLHEKHTSFYAKCCMRPSLLGYI